MKLPGPFGVTFGGRRRRRVMFRDMNIVAKVFWTVFAVAAIGFAVFTIYTVAIVA